MKFKCCLLRQRFYFKILKKSLISLHEVISRKKLQPKKIYFATFKFPEMAMYLGAYFTVHFDLVGIR